MEAFQQILREEARVNEVRIDGQQQSVLRYKTFCPISSSWITRAPLLLEEVCSRRKPGPWVTRATTDGTCNATSSSTGRRRRSKPATCFTFVGKSKKQKRHADVAKMPWLAASRKALIVSTSGVPNCQRRPEGAIFRTASTATENSRCEMTESTKHVCSCVEMQLWDKTRQDDASTTWCSMSVSRVTMTMTMTHSEKSHIRRMKAWPYKQE